jgi:hypothetical protein
MAVRYQALVECKARAPSGAIVNILPGIYTVIGDQPAQPSVWLVADKRQFEVTYAEFQRLKTAGAVEPL